MTTHILIVDKDTFNCHLEYQFIGTGNGRPFELNGVNSPSTSIHHSVEKTQMGMLADCSRLRVGDNIIFYLQQKGDIGGFFGIFKVKSRPFIHSQHDDQYPGLTKALEYRAMIEPSLIYDTPVSEWEALDDIQHICSPYQMLWSLIYRKLKGNRGNTMITMYEADRLISLLMLKNKNRTISLANNEHLIYNPISNKLEKAPGPHAQYNAQTAYIDISQRLIHKSQQNQKFEAHLQAYITQHIGEYTNSSLDDALFTNDERVKWIGNEVSCGVGMQRMDIVVVTEKNEQQLETIYVIELKCTSAEASHIKQMYRYIDWITQYYIPNRPSIIQPILLSNGNIGTNRNPNAALLSEMSAFNSHFMNSVNILPFKLLFFEINGYSILFH